MFNYFKFKEWLSLPLTSVGLMTNPTVPLKSGPASGGNQPDCDPLDHSENDQDILAFRSITTFLSHIEPAPTTHVTQQKPTLKLETDDKQALEILDSLATLIVRRYEIVAVTAKQSGDGLQVLTSLTRPKLNDSTPLPSDSESDKPGGVSNFFCKVFQMIVTANPRRDPVRKGCFEADALLTNRLEHLTVVDPTDSAKRDGLAEISNPKLLDTFLQTKWWVSYFFYAILHISHDMQGQ
jgi:hypothetical protein